MRDASHRMDCDSGHSTDAVLYSERSDRVLRVLILAEPGVQRPLQLLSTGTRSAPSREV